MKTYFALVASLLLAGCGSMSGLDASSSFSCKAPAGVSCQSISGVQSNASQGNLPFQKEDPAKTYGAGDQRNAERKADDKAPLVPYGSVSGSNEKVSPRDMVAEHSGMPVRQPPLVLRVWMAPYEDDDKDLHDQSYFYTVINSGRWMIEANTTALSNQYRPIYPLSRSTKVEPDTVEKKQEPLVKKGDYSNVVEKPDYQVH